MGLKSFLRNRKQQSSSASALKDQESRTTVSSHGPEDPLEPLAADHRWVACLSQVESPTATHILLQHGAPLAVLDACLFSLADKAAGQIVSPEEALDHNGRTPLHIAVAHHCPVETAERLLAGTSMIMPAVVRDVDGRTPLHTLCATPYRRSSKRMDTWHKRQCLQLLLDIDPAAVGVRDGHGYTPLQLAKAQNLGPLIYQALERAMVDCNTSDASSVASACSCIRELSVRRMADDVSSMGCVDVEDGLDPFAGMDLTKLPTAHAEEEEEPVVLPSLLTTSSTGSTEPAPTPVMVSDVSDDDSFGQVEC